MFHRFAGFGRWRRVVDKTAAWLRLRRSCRLVVPGEAGTSLPVWFFTCVLVSAAVYAVAHYVTRRDGVEEITELMKSGMCLYETPRSVYCRGTEGCDLVLPDGTVARASSGGMADGANGENGNASLDTAAAASRPVLVCRGKQDKRTDLVVSGKLLRLVESNRQELIRNGQWPNKEATAEQRRRDFIGPPSPIRHQFEGTPAHIFAPGGVAADQKALANPAMQDTR